MRQVVRLCGIIYIEKFILSGEFIMNDWFNYE